MKSHVFRLLLFIAVCILRCMSRVGSVTFKTPNRFDSSDENEVLKSLKRGSAFFETIFYNKYADLGRQNLLTGDEGRPGDVTDSSSCGEITDVPDALRYLDISFSDSGELSTEAYISDVYTKYTEAYGIPVVGSSVVPDAALTRACYVLRFLLADRQDLRRAYFKSYGRVVVIGRHERLGDVPEYLTLFRDTATGSTRSIGAVPTAPVTTGAEENILCYSDHEPRELDDVLLKSLAIGILNIAAVRVEPGIKRDLDTLYKHAIASGWWSNTNAARGPESYFGEGVQSFFNVNAYAHPANGFHNEINTRTKLGGYDSALFHFIRRMFPCVNNYIKRCNNRGNEAYVTVPMDCHQPGWYRTRKRDRQRFLF